MKKTPLNPYGWEWHEFSKGWVCSVEVGDGRKIAVNVKTPLGKLTPPERIDPREIAAQFLREEESKRLHREAELDSEMSEAFESEGLPYFYKNQP